MLNWFKEKAVNVKAAAVMPPEKLEGKFLIGELYSEEAPEFTAEYDELIKNVRRKFDNFQGGNRGCEQNSD
jgi:2-oxoglutarate ferredoxin oxidoreductase subunit beta